MKEMASVLIQIYFTNKFQLTLELVSTLISDVMFLFFSLVLISAKYNSPFLTPVEVISWTHKASEIISSTRPKLLQQSIKSRFQANIT